MSTTTHPRPLTRGTAPGNARASARGTTLAELLIALGALGVLVALAIRAAARIVDQARARSAAAEVRSSLGLARRAAVLRGERTAVRFDTARAAVAVHVRAETLASRALGRLHGVRLAATRESTAYGGDGLGFGAANLRVIVRRGAAAETVTVSRVGRVR